MSRFYRWPRKRNCEIVIIHGDTLSKSTPLKQRKKQNATRRLRSDKVKREIERTCDNIDDDENGVDDDYEKDAGDSDSRVNRKVDTN